MVNLQYFRKQKGLTQIELAKKLGFGQHAISTWENGTREPDIITLKKMSAIFETSIDELVGNEIIIKNKSEIIIPEERKESVELLCRLPNESFKFISGEIKASAQLSGLL